VDVASVLPGLALAPAAIAVPLIVASRHRPAVREAWSVAASLAQSAIVALMLPAVLAGQRLVWAPLPLAPGVPLALGADALGVLFALVASVLWVLTTVYSIGYTRALREHAQTRYFAAFALCLFSTVGLALAGNLLTFFVFFELLTVATYPLVIHKGTDEATRAGRVYLAYTLTGGTALLGAVAWAGVMAGRLDFVAGGILAPGAATPASLWALLALFVVGCGVKAAVVPLHTWLPLAMIAPTPVSALLHAVAVVKAGVFGFARVVGFVFGPETLRALGADSVLLGLAAATILLGSLAALAQDNLKRLLAFSTVSQLSYVLLGLAVAAPGAVAGALVHIAAHAVLKITLFFCAGALYVAHHVEQVSELGGIGRRMPFTMGAFAAAAFMLAGLPPGAAFVSKWEILSGAAAAGAWPAVAVLLLSTVLNVAYFAPVIVRAFGPGPAAGAATAPGRAEAPPAVLVPLLLTAAAGLLLGLVPDGWPPLMTLARAVAAAVERGP
jgi:multicomponent Na+:H+ antiporter subunit D